MVEYKTINVKLSDSQLNKLKSAVKNKQGIPECLVQTIYPINSY